MVEVHFRFMVCWVVFFILILLNSKANRGDPDQTPRSVASDLGHYCVRMSHKKDTRVILVKMLA